MWDSSSFREEETRNVFLYVIYKNIKIVPITRALLLYHRLVSHTFIHFLFLSKVQTRLILSIIICLLYQSVCHIASTNTLITVKYYAILDLYRIIYYDTCNNEGRKMILDFREASDTSTWKFPLTWTHVRFKLAMRTKCTLAVNHRGKSAEHAEEEELNLHSWI